MMQNVPGRSTSSGDQPTMERTGKKLIVQEYRRRLRDSLRSLNDNFSGILQAAKINVDDPAGKGGVGSGKMTDFYAVRNEMCVRAALMVKAADELLMLTNDVREFLILRDFNFLSGAISSAENRLQEELRAKQTEHEALRKHIQGAIVDIDRELMEHFSLRQ